MGSRKLGWAEAEESRAEQRDREALLSEVGVPATPVPGSPVCWSFPALSLSSSRWLSLLCVTLALVLASEKRTILLGPPVSSALLCFALLCLLHVGDSTGLRERLTGQLID